MALTVINGIDLLRKEKIASQLQDSIDHLHTRLLGNSSLSNNGIVL